MLPHKERNQKRSFLFLGQSLQIGTSVCKSDYVIHGSLFMTLYKCSLKSLALPYPSYASVKKPERFMPRLDCLISTSLSLKLWLQLLQG